MRFWCKFGATLYATILTIFTISHDITREMHDIKRYYTIFTISNGIAKTPRDNFDQRSKLAKRALTTNVVRALLSC